MEEQFTRKAACGKSASEIYTGLRVVNARRENWVAFSIWGIRVMSHITFDTLQFVETLKASGIDEKQAKAIATAYRDASSEQQS